MQIKRCKDQKGETLEEFYTGSSCDSNDGLHISNKAMLSLLKGLENQTFDKNIYGLTSMNRLCLLAENDWESPWYVIISALDDKNYYIEYILPQRFAPWPYAMVKGDSVEGHTPCKKTPTNFRKSPIDIKSQNL